MFFFWMKSYINQKYYFLIENHIQIKKIKILICFGTILIIKLIILIMIKNIKNEL